MAIRLKCDKCNKELAKPGALLFSPPNKKSIVRKFHLCIKCYGEMLKALKK